MYKHKKDPECKECDKQGLIEMDCTATFVAVRYICDCCEVVNEAN